MGWLFKDPVLLFEVDGRSGSADADLDRRFRVSQRSVHPHPAHAEMPGVAGFRLHHPLNRPDVWDELVAFLGASYFRALGRGNAYGLSARGLAVNSGLVDGRGVPPLLPLLHRTSRRLPRDDHGLSPRSKATSVTGAYRFVITPGDETVMDVTARLFFRTDIEQLGVAPLTSMFLFSEKNRGELRRLPPQRA